MEAGGIDPTTIQTSIGAVAASVQAEQPDLRPHAAPDGTIILLLTDIEGSTALAHRLGVKRWLELRLPLNGAAGLNVPEETQHCLVERFRLPVGCAVGRILDQHESAAADALLHEPARR